MKSNLIVLIACATVVLGGIFLVWEQRTGGQAVAQRVQFNRDIRPILNQNCLSCHGGVKQQGGVSFVYREEALGKGKSGRPTVVPGKPWASELIVRVTTADPEARMPYHAPPLQPRQIDLLKEWIREGAHWEDHWAFVAPKPQAVPAVKRSEWVRRPLDRFILARLEQEGLTPSPEASKAALLRRVSFDLIGLPPTPEELSAFIADNSTNAYEKQVDRLLSSPHYGERWAALWLDLARYADSRGYKTDARRPTWPYRDWVIEALNRNMPYDRFVVTQLAGDLLPDAKFEDLIATSFQRQTPVADTGVYEENRMVAVLDRVATTWSVLNGLTFNCVQCHSHPYDPIRHEEFYKFLAFYNSSRDADLPDDSPVLLVPQDAARRTEVAQLQRRQAQLRSSIASEGRAMAERTQWSALPIVSAQLDEPLRLQRILSRLKAAAARLSAAQSSAEKEYLESLRKEISQTEAQLRTMQAQGAPLVPLKVERGDAKEQGTIPSYSVYELTSAVAPPVVTALRIEAPPVNPEKARHTPEDGFIVDQVEAAVISPTGEESKIEFRHFAPDSDENISAAARSYAATMQPSDVGSTKSEGGFDAEGGLFQLRWTIGIPEGPLHLAPGSKLKVRIMHGADVSLKPAPMRTVRLASSSDARWTTWANSSDLNAKFAELTGVEKRLAEIPSVGLPVMVELPAYHVRQTLRFDRGNQLQKTGPAFSPDVPKAFAKLPPNEPRDRLAMARWFFQADQPLTARVAVNRYWEQLFGTGIVETLEDFGSVGSTPSHPELLDWLALRFQNDLRWDMKALLRELVTSATYCQEGKVTEALLNKDPRNRLLARGPQQRLTAEMVRDQALTASGLLNPMMGGPPVMPPQPAAVFNTDLSASQWIDASGPERYRRAIYTLLKRSSIYPSFVAFDMASHVVSSPRRIPTNTPLQALVILNDPVYQEAAQALAKRMPTAQGLQARLNAGAQRVLSRNLYPEELAALTAFYADARNISGVSNAESDMAAITAVASALLNFDAALTR